MYTERNNSDMSTHNTQSIVEFDND